MLNRLLIVWIFTLCLVACSADLDWRESTLPNADIQVKSLMPSKPQQHQTRLTYQTTQLGSNELISRVEINKARGLFVLAVAELPTKLPIKHTSQQDLEQIFTNFLQTQQALISTQLKQKITLKEQKLFTFQQANHIKSQAIELVQEKWLIDQASELSLASSAAALSAQTISHISRFVLIKKEHQYWMVQQVYRGSLPLSKDELSFWFSSLSIH